MTKSATIPSQFAEWCGSLRYNQIPENVLAALPLRLLDTTGLILTGMPTTGGKIALDFVQTHQGIAQSTVCNYAKRLPASSAALVHGIAAHCRDYDDTFLDSLVHPGSIVIPTALAIAEKEGVSSEDFALSVIVGYEIAARLGSVAGLRFHARNLHPTGIIGPIAAAVTAANLLKLKEEQIIWAMGLAASMSSGLRAFAVDGGWSKWLHVGWAAHGGIVAAEMASRGFRGPEYILEGNHDLYSAFLHGETINPKEINKALGSSWKGNKALFKYYPCAYVIQPFLNAFLFIKKKHGLNGKNIKQIECTLAPWAAAIVCEPRSQKLTPETDLSATGSLPYQIAVSAFEENIGLSAIGPQMRERREILEFASKVTHCIDPTLQGDLDGEICVRTFKGDKYAKRITENGIEREKVEQKFLNNVTPIIGKERAINGLSELLNSDKIDWRWALKQFSNLS